MLDEVQLEYLRGRLAELGRPYEPADIAVALRVAGFVVTDILVRSALEKLRATSTGVGPLEPLLEDPAVSDVLVNGSASVFVDRGKGLEPAPIAFDDEAAVRRLAIRLAGAAGRRLDAAAPFVDGRLPNGIRLHAVLGPVAEPGTCISLRVPARRNFTLAALAEAGSMPNEIEDLLRRIIARRLPFLISGGTGTGKTTLLAALLALVPASERIVLVEDSRELVPDHPHIVRLEGRPQNGEGKGAIMLTELVRQALRMRPDRLVLGEVRGAELTDLLNALNTGHEGGCGTVHANSVADVPARLEALAMLGGLSREACHAQLAAALKVVVHLRRGVDGLRRLAEIAVLERGISGLVEVHSAVRIDSGSVRRGEGWELLQRLVSR